MGLASSANALEIPYIEYYEVIPKFLNNQDRGFKLPRISEFFGIVVYMYWFDNKRHKSPHIHAIFNNKKAVFDFKGNCIAGDIGSRATRLVKDFMMSENQNLKRLGN